ncbi:hypothetical protein [Pseudomonas sp. NPDC087817]|uniref:hypothetical protein n=1 Tax=Pseudomonas sp. NPDC087817 TaxID=3364451 RepID=UPI00380AEA0E
MLICLPKPLAYAVVSFGLNSFSRKTAVSENAYAPAEAQLLVAGEQTPEFYVVARWKFILLSILSFGLYFYFWIYKNWSLHKRSTQQELWPWARAFFYLFFVHQLYRLAKKRILDRGGKSNWDLEQWATVFVVLTVVAHIFEKLPKQIPELSFLGLVALVMLPIRVYVASEGQQLINLAANDPQGLSNNRLNAWNLLIILPGVAVWLLVGLLLAGVYP